MKNNAEEYMTPEQLQPYNGEEHMEGTNNAMSGDELLNVQIFVPELGVQKCLSVHLDEVVWDVKRKLLATLQEQLQLSFNYGLFLPPCDGRAGKFLLEDRPIRDYPFHDCVPYLEVHYHFVTHRRFILSITWQIENLDFD
ncbi:unnamed protein product [Toxocara canis]|uniref:FERM domain-containing protein n=1 Tax=Toxocara canis TaxID=6265 RepID=A0A183VCL7_TOXCA|nr:unnamed protein product [Toxocara canis]